MAVERDTTFFRNAPESAPWRCDTLTVSEGLKEEWERSQSRRQLKLAQAKASIMRALRHQSPETHERMDYVFSRKKRDLSSPAPRAKVTLAMELPFAEDGTRTVPWMLGEARAEPRV